MLYSITSSKALLYWLNSHNPKYSKTQNNSLLIAALASENPDRSTSSVMGNLREDGSYMREGEAVVGDDAAGSR